MNLFYCIPKEVLCDKGDDVRSVLYLLLKKKICADPVYLLKPVCCIGNTGHCDIHVCTYDLHYRIKMLVLAISLVTSHDLTWLCSLVRKLHT